jgi:type II secretory pathway pseudopilin PulG
MSARSVRRPLSRLRAAGYTAVEVMLALTVLLISTAGVMSMQKASIQANVDARKLDMANSIARTWLDRLATDSLTWNANNGLTQTLWLNALMGAGFQSPSPQPAAAPIYSSAFDILGRDLPTPDTDTTAVFCARVKVDLIANFGTPPTPALLNVTVLIYWAKDLLGSAGTPSSPLCGTSAPADIAAQEAATPGTYHMLYITESLRRTD